MRFATTTVAALIALGAASPATAYHVQESDEGLPLRWAPGEVQYHIDPQGGLPVEAPAFEAALDAAFAAWAALPETTVNLARGPDAPGGFGRYQGGYTVNAVRYEAEAWEYEPDALMLTFTRYRVRDGAIIGSDILINGVGHRWHADGQPDDDEDHALDLQNSLTHEVGHFLGLAHSPEHPEATMYPSTVAGEQSKRRLATDDTDGIDYLYVAEALPPASSDQSAGCSVGRRGTGATAMLATLLLALAATRTRRRGRAAVGRSGWGMPLLAALVLLSASAVGATTLRYRSVEDLARSAEMVVQGRVVATRSHLVGRLIVTDTTLRVASCLRGACGASVVVRQPGGEVGAIGLRVEGTFRARPGDEVLLFLRRGRDGVLAPIGMQHGALRIERSPGRPPVAVRELGGVVGARRGVASPEPRQVLLLEAIVALVKTNGDRRSR